MPGSEIRTAAENSHHRRHRYTAAADFCNLQRRAAVQEFQQAFAGDSSETDVQPLEPLQRCNLLKQRMPSGQHQHIMRPPYHADVHLCDSVSALQSQMTRVPFGNPVEAIPV